MMLRVPLFFPADVGLNITVAVQEFPLGMVLQSSVSLKSEGLTVTWLIKRLDWPLFVIVTALSDGLPGFIPKLTDLGLTTIFGVLVPDAFCGL